MVEKLKNKILIGKDISQEEALMLLQEPLEELCRSANEIREKLCGNNIDLCTIVNGKSGRCTENCKFCAQSKYYKTGIEEYPLMSSEEIVKWGKYNENKGVNRYSVVTSGRTLSSNDLEDLCNSYRTLKEETNIKICASHGLLNYSELKKLKDSGVTRYHNNLETSEKYFKNICTTHTFQDKIDTIKAAKLLGLEVCCGGIFGLGEKIEDRIDMFFSLRELDIDSIPINILNPIPGTEFETNSKLSLDEIRRSIAIARFVFPKKYIRLAGGRGLFDDMGESLFLCGINAMITGDMLTTKGISIDDDIKIIKKLGYEHGNLK